MKIDIYIHQHDEEESGAERALRAAEQQIADLKVTNGILCADILGLQETVRNLLEINGRAK